MALLLVVEVVACSTFLDPELLKFKNLRCCHSDVYTWSVKHPAILALPIHAKPVRGLHVYSLEIGKLLLCENTKRLLLT